MIQFIRSLFIVSFVLLPFLASAQLARGFTLLKQSEYEQAIKAFAEVADAAPEGIAAKFGLAKCYLGQGASVGDLANGFSLLRSSRETFRNLNQGDKSKLSKYEITLNGIDRLMEDLQMLAIQLASDNFSLLQLDTMMENMAQPATTRVQKKMNAARVDLVQYAVENANDYPTLTSLIKKHYLLVTTNSFKNQLSVRQKLRPSFIRRYGYEKLSQFVEDHPRHAFSIDCWVQQFIEAARPVTVKKMLRFLIDCPYSTLDVFAAGLVSRDTKKGTVIRNDLRLDPAEKEQLEILKMGWELDDIIQDEESVFNEAALQKFYTFIPKKRSTRIGYEMVHDALEKCLKQRQWASANAILAFAQPLFPDFQPEGCKTRFSDYQAKQSWFGTVSPIVNRAEEGLFRKRVEGINTQWGDEYAPVPSADGKSLYFAAQGRGESVGGEDIYVAYYDFDTQTWSEPELVPSLATTENESPVAITFDGNEMLLFREGKLYTSRLRKEGWGPPVRLPNTINGFAWVGEATFSSDGKVMIFAASETMPGLDEDSNKDIYVTHKDAEGRWSAPQLLGMDVNTFEDDRSPFLYPDDRTLYFSSAGHPGLGGMDIFVTRRLDDTWTNWSVPKNLGKEVNSLDDNWGYTVSLNPHAWDVYSSKAELSNGLNDIYTSALPTFARPPGRVIPFTGRVVNAATKDGIPAKIVVSIPGTGEPLDTVVARPDGTFTLPVRSGKGPLEYHVLGENLFPQSKSVSVDQILKNPGHIDTIGVSSITDMVNYRTPVILNNINFDYDKSELKPESYPELERVCALLRDNAWHAEFAGHTDDIGSSDYNLTLSLQRAEAVKAFMVKKGIPADRLSTRGFGAEKPAVDNKTDVGRAQNRRVEMRILK